MPYYLFAVFSGFSIAVAVFYFPIVIGLIGKMGAKRQWPILTLSAWLFAFIFLTYLVVAGFIRERYAPPEPIKFFVSIAMFTGISLGLWATHRVWRFYIEANGNLQKKKKQ